MIIIINYYAKAFLYIEKIKNKIFIIVLKGKSNIICAVNDNNYMKVNVFF